MNRDKQTEIDELAKAIFLNCHCGLFEDEAEMIAKFCYQEIDKKASDVAREIFEEIYDRLLQSFPPASFIDAPCTTHDRIFDMIAELKKKYTKEE